MSVNNTLLEKQQALVALSSKYLDYNPADVSYQEICDDLLHLSGAAYAVVNVLVPDNTATKTVAISGLSKNLQKASEIFGFNPLGKAWPVDEFAITTMRSSKLINQGDIETASPHISRKIGALLKSVFGIGAVYSVGLFRREKVLGTLVLILPKGKEIEHPEIIEIFAQQIGSLLAHTAHERKLQHEHSKLNALSVNSPDLLILVDHQYKVQYMNKVLPGFDMAKVIGDDVLNYVFPDYRQAYSEWLAEVFQSEKPLVREVKAVGQFGVEAFYKITFTPVTQPGEASMIYIVASDITERKQNEDRFKALFEESQGLLCTHDLQGNLLSINTAAAQSLGYKPAELIGQNLLGLLHPQGKSLFTYYLEQITQHKQHAGLMSVLHKNGEPRVWNYQNKLTKTHNGTEVVIGNAIDVTDKIKAENALRESEARLKLITGTINEVFYLYNILEKKYEFISLNCADLLGVNDAFFYQGNSYTTQYVHEEDKESLFQANNDIDAGIAYEIEYRIWVKGQLRWVNEKSFPIKNAEGLTVKNSGLVADITQRKKVEIQLKQNFEFQKIIAELSSQFVKTTKESFDDEIDEMLRKLGQHFAVDRSYLFFLSEDGTAMSNTHEWCNEGIEPQKDNLQSIPIASQVRLYNELDAGKYVHIPDVDLLPEEASAEKELFQAQGIQSVIFVPLKGESRLWGMIGFNAVKARYCWNDNEINHLQTVANAVCNLLLKLANQERINKSEERLQLAIEGVGDGLWDWNMETKTMTFSPLYEQMLGYEVGELLPHEDTWVNSVHPDDLSGVQQNLGDYLAGKLATYHPELRLQCKDGSYKWVLCRGKVNARNTEGKPIRMVGIHSDITDRKRKEAELVAINREIKDITNAVNASSLVSITDSKGTIVKINHRFCELSGYSEAELLGQNHRIINSGHHDKLFWRELWQTITAGKVWKGEVKNRAKDGSEYWVSSVINPIFDEVGKITHYLSIRQDITGRKKAELDLEATKEKLDSIFIEMDDVVWSVSLPDYKMLYMTPSAVALYGITYEEFMAESTWWEKVIYEEDKPVIHKIYKQLNDLGHYDEEYRIVARDGKIKWVSNKGKVIHDAYHLPIRLDGYVRDISERKFAEQHLKESEANLREAHIIAKLGRWELDLIFNRLHWSDSVFEIFEIDQEKFGATYEGFLNTIHPDDRQLVNDAYTRSLETKQPYEVVHRLQMKDSRIKWLKETCRTDYDAEGKALRSVGVVQDITESKIAEIELQNTKNFLAQTNQVARVGGWDFNNLTGEIIWSDIIREIHEVPHGFVPTYEQMANFYTPESWSNLEKAIQQTMTDGTPYDLELQITTAKNRLLWVRAIGNAEFKEGKCTRLFGVLQDIDTDKKNRLRIERSEESLNNAQQIAKMGSWELDVKTNEVIWTEELYKMYGFDPTVPPPPYTEYMKLFTPESWELLSTSLAQTSEKGIPYELELKTIKKDKGHGWMWVRGEAVFDKNHKIIALRGAAQDITDRKKAEEKIAKQNEFRKLIAEISTSFVRSDVDTIDSIIDTTLKTCALHFDTDRSFLFQINHEAETFTNTHDWHNADCPSMQHRVQDVPLHTYTWFAQKLAGQSIFVINDVETAPEEAAAEKAEWKEQHIKSVLFIRFDINNRPAGVLGLASCTKAIEWNDDQISGLSVVANIISDGLSKYALEKGLMDAKEKADLANRAKSEFLANMSHEIRTPLNSILGFSEILLQSIKEPKASGHLQTILNSGRTLLSLINDLLDLAKIEAGKLEFQPDSIDINSMLAEVKEMFEAQASKKNIILKTELTSSFPKYILVDDVRLKQMLINLMGNAVKFTPDGGVSLRAGFLQLKGNDNRGILEITIADTGIGISENDIAAIFESFNQGTNRSTKNFGGTGLGLAITKRLVEAMGGSIRVKSQFGVGSEFTITLPNVHFVVNDTAKDKPNDTGELISAQFKPATLLVVDDVANNRDLVEAFLEGHNLNLVMAANGHEAVTLAVQHKPDLILMDLRMPEMNGEEAAKLIKANKDLMHIPIVAFTASILAHEVLDDCFVSLLSKPVQGKMLFDELRKYLPYEPSASPEKEFSEAKTESDLQNELGSHFTHLQQNHLERINALAYIMNVSDMEQLLVELNEYADQQRLTSFKAYLSQLDKVFQEFDLDELSDRLSVLGKLISSAKDR